jgi:hypothetical protein
MAEGKRSPDWTREELILALDLYRACYALHAIASATCRSMGHAKAR